MTWTRFMDMHSGGGLKESFAYCYIEAPGPEAKLVFFHRFGHNPERVSCTCCGSDYSISEYESLEQATAYERGCAYAYRRPDGTECSQGEAWVPGQGIKPGYSAGYVERRDTRYSSARRHFTLEEWKVDGVGNIEGGVHFIYAAEIKPEERVGDLPEQGYVWQD